MKTPPTYHPINDALTAVRRGDTYIGGIHRIGEMPPFRFAFWPVNDDRHPSCATIETCKEAIK